MRSEGEEGEGFSGRVRNQKLMSRIRTEKKPEHNGGATEASKPKASNPKERLCGCTQAEVFGVTNRLSMLQAYV